MERVTLTRRNGAKKPAEKLNPVSKAGGKVSIACKLPHGLIMQCWEFVEEKEPILGGGYRTFKVARARKGADGDAVKYFVNGINTPRAKIAFGYAITENLPEDFVRLYFEQHADQEFIKNKLVFFFRKLADTEACAKEHEKTLSGLEPMSVPLPNELADVSDPRWRAWGSRNRNVTLGTANLKD